MHYISVFSGCRGPNIKEKDHLAGKLTMFLEAGKCETVSRSKSFFVICCINGRWPFSSSKALHKVYKAKKLRTQDDAFGKIEALLPFMFCHAVSLHSFKTVNSLLFASYAKNSGILA